MCMNKLEEIFKTLFGGEKSLCYQNDIEEAEEILDESVTLGSSFGNDYQHVQILIDNGHGDSTLGKRSPYSAHGIEPAIDFYEYKWNREIANRIVDELTSMGYSASLLVPELKDVSLSERVKRVNAVCDKHGAKNVILVSIHANAAGNGDKWMTAKGWSAYTTVGQTNSDKLAECLYEAAEEKFSGRKIRKDNSDGDKDWESNFYICQKTKCITVLTENFFYDNESDVKYILSEEGKDAVVKTHVDGIINFIKSNF